MRWRHAVQSLLLLLQQRLLLHRLMLSCVCRWERDTPTCSRERLQGLVLQVHPSLFVTHAVFTQRSVAHEVIAFVDAGVAVVVLEVGPC